MHICVNIIGPGLWESFQGPLAKRQVQLLISFGGMGLLSMEDYAPSIFLRSWALMVPYLCSKFRIFNRPILKEYVFQIENSPHLFWSCPNATRDGLLLGARDMHPFLSV
jgi:hypothetical protein